MFLVLPAIGAIMFSAHLASAETAAQGVSVKPSRTMATAPLLRPVPLTRAPEDTAGAAAREMQQDNALPSLASDPDARLLERIGEDLASLDRDSGLHEINEFARFTLDVERPDLFRLVMSAHLDENWSELSDARTALNMIAWLPDTADYLPTRIIAARLATGQGELDLIEEQRLWRELRARVERVADPRLLDELVSAMIRSQSIDLVIDTVMRFHPTPGPRILALSRLLDMNADILTGAGIDRLQQEIITARAQVDQPDLDRNIVRAFWSARENQEAFDILDQSEDTASRLRIMMHLLEYRPPEEFSPPDSGTP